MKHSRKHIIILVMFSICINPLAFAEGASKTMEHQEKMLIDFSSADERDQWRIINDGVMGGVSQSEIVFSDEGTAIFQGTVSLENNGGFASTRTIPRSYNIGDYSGLVMRVKGDGQQYQVRLHTDDRFDGVSYRHHFETQSDTWMTIRIPFREFVPVFRGRILNDVPPVSPEQIQQIGFLIADKQAGNKHLLDLMASAKPDKKLLKIHRKQS